MEIIESIELFLYACAHVAWPIALYGLAFMFRDDIRSLFIRVSQISVGQNTLNLRAEAQQEAESGGKVFSAKGGLMDDPSQESDSEAYDRLMTFHDSETLDSFERIIRATLPKSLSEAQRTEVLIRNLAHTQMISEFQLISMSVFGSQIELLSQLNENFPNGMNHEAVRNFFDNVRAVYVQAFDSWDLGRYLRYLEEGTSLLRRDAERIYITGKGREYLIWRTQNGIANHLFSRFDAEITGVRSIRRFRVAELSKDTNR